MWRVIDTQSKKWCSSVLAVPVYFANKRKAQQIAKWLNEEWEKNHPE
jgi:hypothetical protein